MTMGETPGCSQSNSPFSLKPLNEPLKTLPSSKRTCSPATLGVLKAGLDIGAGTDRTGGGTIRIFSAKAEIGR